MLGSANENASALSAVIFAQGIVRLLRAGSFRVRPEIALQSDISEQLASADVEYKREFNLGLGDRPDFMLDMGVVIEAKSKCVRRDTYRQLERYAKRNRVACVILVSATFMGLPDEIAGKPAFFVHVGRGTL